MSRATGVGHPCFGSLIEQLSDLAGPAGRETDACLGCGHCTKQTSGFVGKVNFVWRGGIWNSFFRSFVYHPRTSAWQNRCTRRWTDTGVW